ncbi:MAG: serine/threonine protein kinase [Deltaproteobacteria bacterium]|nr:serine/threonine protein kinase [Deltaproteobacteria bacterium]MBK8237830.1 serine/threonine protein kinase [Deltaproteobacteria bacterium]MBP7289770.1 serine/threonine protein kinase [Nannocystaceae bacterium]
MSLAWVDRMLGGTVGHPLLPAADAIVARFADGAARPQEVARLAAFTDALAREQPSAALEPELRALSHAGFLRGAMVAMATRLRAAPQPELALMLARELLDAIDAELGVALLQGVLSLPQTEATRWVRGGIHARTNLMLGEQLLEQGDADAALRHFEAVLALDIDHRRALRGWQLATQALARRGVPTPQTARGLSLLDGLEELEGQDAFGLARYELARPLGRGRHAVVYQAYDRHVGREVAIKRLLEVDARAGAGRVLHARFFDEARTLARVRSPHVVALLDAQPRHRLIALELCRGGNLRLALRRGLVGPADLPRVAGELRAALEAVHAAGAVHRDVKPANILVRTAFRGSQIALADFGVALAQSPAAAPGAGAGPSAGPTAAAAPAGTLRYLAPELRRGQVRASPASDRFSAGVVLLEMLLYPAALPDALDRIDDDLDATALIPDDAPSATRNMLSSLLAGDPDARTW